MGVPCQPLNIRPLDCTTDSITLCPGLDPIPITISQTVDVNVTNTVDVAITNIPHVIVDNEIEIKNDAGNPVPISFTRLDCATDSVEICNDAGNPITVEITNTPVPVSGSLTVEFKQPGVAGTIVAGSRWQANTVGALGTAPTADSPACGANQRIIVDWIECTAGVGVTLGLVLTAPLFQIVNTDGAPGTVYWANSGTLPIAAGSVFSLENTPVIQGEQGEQLRIRLSVGIAILQASVAFGGYIVDV